MNNIDKLASLDLNLLTAFEALAKARSVTNAAKMLGLSQPAMSHILARLRQALGDQLFVKTPKEMVPTPKAMRLAPYIHEILSRIERTILDVEEFSSKKLVRTFHIKTTDFIEVMITPKLLSRLESEAPQVKISVTSPEFSLPREMLEQGSCDMAIGGFFGELPDGFYQQKLFEDGFVCAVRRGHPRLGEQSTMRVDEFCRERHILIAPSGELHSQLDRILRTKKKSRSVVAGCSSYVVAGWILEETDSVLTAPSKLIDILSRKFELNELPLPVKSPKISVVQVWHERNHQDPEHKWFRDLVRKAFQGL